MSHLDYRSIAKKHFPRTVQWRTSLAITEQGFRDSYRENNPVVDRKVDSTWSPKFPEQEQDRIDFIYYKSSQFQSIKSKVIRTHAVKFPSDHAAVVTTFQGEKSPSAALPIDVSVLSYNIRRGFGTDNKTDLSRTMKVIQNQKVDVVGLQEVDLFVRRSGKTHQLNYLSKELNVHSAFGFFIPYQGGRYGMGVLSRHPFSKVQEFEIPKGNEPRIALACKVRLPNGSEILVVNIHLDWVRDDTFRFGQAKKLKEHLSKLKLPYILLGDFNDTPDSRTLKLLTKGGLPAEKPANQRFTYPATKPKSEIDFVVAFPANRWKLKEAKVVAEKLASDHRPVFAKFQLLPEKSETPKK